MFMLEMQFPKRQWFLIVTSFTSLTPTIAGFQVSIEFVDTRGAKKMLLKTYYSIALEANLRNQIECGGIMIVTSVITLLLLLQEESSVITAGFRGSQNGYNEYRRTTFIIKFEYNACCIWLNILKERVLSG